MKKRKLIFVIGNSGSGKDTLVNYLVEHYGWYAVSSFTTRRMRKDEINGCEHIFLPWGSVANNPEAWLQHRGLHLLAKTFYGGHHYFTAMEQLTHQFKGEKKRLSTNHMLHEPIMRAIPVTTPVMYIINEEGFTNIMERDAVASWLHDNFDFELWNVRRPSCDVDNSRTQRDDGRLTFPDTAYKYIIHNNYDLEYLYSYLDAIVARL